MNPFDPQPSSRGSDALPDAVKATAARWVARRHSGLTPAQRSELFAWLAVDERHARAFREADLTRDDLDWPVHSGTTDAVIVGLRRRARKRLRRRAFIGMAAAGVAALGAAWWLRMGALPQAGSTLVVVAPERRTLPDGSVVELTPGAEISVEFSDRFRVVTLKQGVAHFEVAPNPQRPFVVRAGEIAVRAVGTAFAVDRKAGAAVRVFVTHGQVALDAPAQFAGEMRPATPSIESPLALVSAGSLALVEPPSAALGSSARAPGVAVPVVRTATKAEVDAATGWRHPRLEFSGTPLAEVVATINRYNRVQFVVADQSLSTLRLSGALRADKVDALVEILETDFPVRAERERGREGGERIALHRR